MGTQWLMDFGWGHSALEGLWRASWQGGLWAAVVWALTRAVPRMPSALRAGLWWLVSLKFVLSLATLAPVPLPLLPAPAAAPGRDVPLESVSGAPVTGVTVVTAAQPRLALEGAVPWRQVGVAVLLVAWGLGVAWQLRRHLRAWASVRSLRLRALPLRHSGIEEAVRELASCAGLRRVPRLLVSEEVTSPLATGLLSSVVVLPARAVGRLDVDALRMALAHELAHFQRRDLWLGWVPAVAETVLFFHPLVRKAVREYALAREEACDAEALHLTGAEPGDYGQLLLTFGVTRTHGTAAALGASAHIHTLHRRLTMLEHVDVSTPRGRAPLRAALLVLGLAALVPFQVVAREQTASPPPPARAPDPAATVLAAPKLVVQASVVPVVAPVPLTPKVAPVPTVPKIAPVAPTPRVAPVAPVPPPAPMLAMADKDDDDDDDDDVEGFVFVSGDEMTMAGSTADLRRARALRTGGKDVLFVRRGDKNYVVRDAKMLEQMRASFQPQVKMGTQQAELGKRQADLGMKQAEFGQKQAALGLKQAQLGMKLSDLSLKVAQASMQGDESARQRHEQELDKQQEAVEKEMDALNEQQEALGKEQEKLGDQQEALAREGMKKLKALIDEALSKGLAEPVDS
ncbi:M56 family metallopeptidase [Hyalangium sp.]|uniref:M56 family metallopeptidase n=1 Tax=Hyalangium sp. TaxID=2028555 RepID=UPI002D25E11C|nr:M56 family metallopeptidase [Hyalangium sp.]HYI02561.1 M56 family metallopeptidase [Hyalangium sp.]